MTETVYHPVEKVVITTTLAIIVGMALKVNYERLHQYAELGGTSGSDAVLTALGIDAIAIASGYIATRSPENRIARATMATFMVVSAGIAGFVGFSAAGPLGLSVALLPVLGIEFGYRLTTSVLFGYRTRPPRTKWYQFWRPSGNPVDHGKTTVVTEVPTPTGLVNQQITAGTTDQVRKIVSTIRSQGAPYPGRTRIQKDFNVNQSTARKVVAALNS